MTYHVGQRSPIDALHNAGLFRLNDNSRHQQETIVVLGAARSGTSMVAGVLHKLGIYMGDRLGPVYEDVALSDAVERRDVRRVQNIVEVRNARHNVWGWKRPSAVDHMSVIAEQFRNPCLIAVFRDVFAIANRNRISMRDDVVNSMRSALRYYVKLADVLAGTPFPTLLVSYEKAMADRSAFVQELRSWARADAMNVEAAVTFVRPDPQDYLVSSRITQARGFLDVVDTNRIAGWAMLVHSQAPAEVSVLVNGDEVAVARATLHRPDLLAKRVHPTGDCGFSVALPPNHVLRAGDEVRVRVVGDIVDLNGSPRICWG